MACDCCDPWLDLLFLFVYFVGFVLAVAWISNLHEFFKFVRKEGNIRKVSDWLQIGKRYTELKKDNDSLREQCKDLLSDKLSLTLKVVELEVEIKRLGDS